MSMTKSVENVLTDDYYVWGGDDPFTHMLVVGPTRCGKSSTIIKPLVVEILKAKKRGEKCGFTLIEPKGELAREIYEVAKELDLTDDMVYVDPEFPKETKHINVMKGNKNDVAEATVAILKSLFGKQDAFFATVQELSSRKVTLLLKELYGDNMDILDVLANLRDENLLKQNVEKYRSQFGSNDLIQFFDHELLGSGNMAEKYRQYIVGLRSQLENITSNEYLRSIVTGKSDIDLDEHLEKGGILIANTSLGRLGRSGDAFGMFLAMHMQLATFRRPGTERSRVPHYLIIDEYSRYINPDTERFLSIAASYRVALIAAIQSLSQLEIESGTLTARAMKNAVLNSMRNKVVFGGIESADAIEISKMMGTDLVIERTRSYDGGILKDILPKMYKDQEVEKVRFHPTLLMDGLPRFHCICKMVKNGAPQKPFVAKGEWVPNNIKEVFMKEEEERFSGFLKKEKPSILKWKERAIYNVERYEYENAQRIKLEKQQELLNNNPFEQLELEENNQPSLVLNEILNKQKNELVEPVSRLSNTTFVLSKPQETQQQEQTSQSSIIEEKPFFSTTMNTPKYEQNNSSNEPSNSIEESKQLSKSDFLREDLKSKESVSNSETQPTKHIQSINSIKNEKEQEKSVNVANSFWGGFDITQQQK